MPQIQPSLFGIKNSNRNFNDAETWGKNQFNSSFPASLCCYMFSKEMEAVYLNMKNGKYTVGYLSIKDLFGMDPLSNHVFFSFESAYPKFQRYLIGNIPRTDLIIQDLSSKEAKHTSFLEIKLTALPDNTTFDLGEDQYGSELVIRPDTIVYLATSLYMNNEALINEIFKNDILKISDWSDPSLIIPFLFQIRNSLQKLVTNNDIKQVPLLLQPVWKTIGKSPMLSENCLDAFVWSDAAFVWFILEISSVEFTQRNINRQTRTMVWLYKLLQEISQNGKVSHEKVIDEITFNTKNDKAFASSGNITNRFMSCPELIKPRITKSELRNIILGNGQNLLSPERRFDAIIFNSPELFK